MTRTVAGRERNSGEPRLSVPWRRSDWRLCRPRRPGDGADAVAQHAREHRPRPRLANGGASWELPALGASTEGTGSPVDDGTRYRS